MTVTLNDVLKKFGFAQKQIISLVKLAIATGCYGNIPEANKELSDEQTTPFLEKIFTTTTEGKSWWVKLTQENWLRSNFKNEGDKKGPGANSRVALAARWYNEKKIVLPGHIQQLLKDLGLMDAVEWPEEKNQDDDVIVVPGMMEEYVRERIKYVITHIKAVPKKLKLIYPTNPRGLFNNEPSLAPILASWFGLSDQESIEKIQSVLNKYKNPKDSGKHWLGKEFDQLKHEILVVLGKKEWPANIENSWYCKARKIYDFAFENEIIPNSLNGWPTEMDMVEYLLKSDPQCFEKITLVPIYAVKGPMLVANTEDTFENFFKLYADQLKGKNIFFVSDNANHYIQYQDRILQKVLRSLPSNVVFKKVMTVGPGTEVADLDTALDALAKIFYLEMEESRNHLARAIVDLQKPNPYFPDKKPEEVIAPGKSEFFVSPNPAAESRQFRL